MPSLSDENPTKASDEEQSGPNSRNFAIDMSNLNATLHLLSMQKTEAFTIVSHDPSTRMSRFFVIRFAAKAKGQCDGNGKSCD